MSHPQEKQSSSRVSNQSTPPSFSNMRDSVQFWRGVVGYRQADYRGDVPEPISGLSNDPLTQSLRNRNSQLQHPHQRNDSHHHGMSMISTTSTQPPTGPTRGGRRPARRHAPSHRSSSCINPLERHRNLLRMLNSTGWKTTLILCSVILLFGAQLRDLAFPASADLVVDCVFLVVLVFLLVDIACRCDAEPHYFSFRCCRSQQQQQPPSLHTHNNHWALGSFLFWCDVLSTVTLLYDVRLLTERWGIQEVVIELNSDGIPISGMERYNQHIPVEYDPNMLVLVVQTLRVARFIRSSRAVKISSHLGSFLRCLLLCERTPRTTRMSEPPTSVRSGSTSLWGWGSAGFKRSSLSSSSRWLTMWGRPDHTEEFRRTLAATKIQRAWRAARQTDGAPDLLASTDFDVGWRPPASRRRPNDVDGIAGGPPPGAMSPAMRGNCRPSTRRRNESQVGSAMRELTGQRVAVGIILALLLTVLFTYVENDATMPFTMVVLHAQTSNLAFAEKALSAAKNSSVPNMFRYESSNSLVEQDFFVEVAPELLRVREQLRIVVLDNEGYYTTGYFSRREERFDEAFVGLMSTIFILFVWFFGVTGFAGPVMVLVVVPIERMVRLLGMLMVDPLGYQSTSRYKRFVDEEDEITKNTRWSKEILKGMETSFLMSTILRIGSLMKVGFGSAGVEIIRNNLEPGQSQNTLILSSQGSTVSCIFLFCDIRNFTDATECLQEEVFVFTNRIAAVVHSFCHAYGGSANKNVGDAFLLSWQLEEENISMDNQDSFSWSQHQGSATKLDGFVAKNNQADKALLSVVKICMSLNCDDYFIEPLTEVARSSLVNKLKQRAGPVVQMGFGLHAGRAVQGAIGSQRKIDATYVSEAVERAEFLESSTKQYGLRLLMSDSFHRLLNPSNKRRCRKVDQIRIRDDEDGEDEIDLNCETMDLFTFDMDIEALSFKHDGPGREASDTASDAGSKRGSLATKRGGRRLSMRVKSSRGVDDSSVDDFDPIGSSYLTVAPTKEEAGTSFQLILPTGPALYNPNVWTSEDMKTIRELYSDGLFFQKFTSGLQSFYAKDWDNAKQCFSVILERFEDGPSRYFVRQIEKHNGKPPRDFKGYGMA